MKSHCLVILADGARADVMEDLALKGQLPAIGEYLIGQGGLRHGVSVFPSTTGPAYLPYLTGCFPGTCNVPGIRWFDKKKYGANFFSYDRFRSYVGLESFLINQDLDPSRKTLFEIIPHSMNLFSAINRGVSFSGNRSKLSRIFHWYYAHLTDHWALVDESAEKKVLRALESKPEFFFAVFPCIDEYSHLSSPFHPKTLEAYRKLDQSVGRIVQSLKQKGIWESTMLFIVSDHGLSETKTHLPLNQFLEDLGVPTFYYPKIVFKWGVQAASMVSGNGMSNVYFRNADGWKERTPWEDLMARKDCVVERLLERPEVDLMAAQSQDGSVVVKSKRGEARISVGARSPCPGGESHKGTASLTPPLHYRIIGSDPFGYPKLPEHMSSRESFIATASTDYPDAPMQLLQIFRSQRAGDLILSAAKGCDLRQRHEIPEHKSSHGSLHWEHMNVPIVSNVSLPEGPMRSADVFPLILQGLNRPIPEGIDGRL